MSDEDKTIDNSSECSGKVSSKRSVVNNETNDSLPKRPRMNLWEHQTKTLVSSNKDDTANACTDDSASDDTSSDIDSDEETSLEELAANICCLPGNEYIPEELELYPWLISQTDSFKSVYLYFRNKACMLWLKDPKNQLIEKALMQFVNMTCNDKFIQDVISAKLCNFNRNTEEDSQKTTQNRLNTVDRIILKKSDIDSILKDNMYKENMAKIAAMAIAFLERYGYVNIGNFNKHIESYSNGSLCGPEGSPLQVIVVGAGLSGIVAALQLQYFGCKVLVLESQEHAGGRLKTFQKNGYQVDVSPFSITGINNPVNQLIKQAGLSVSFFHGETDIVGVDGDQITRDSVSRVECEVNRLLAAAKDVSNKFSLPENVTLGELIEALLALQMSHCRNLKRNSNSLMLKLLSRLQEIVTKLEEQKAEVAKAHEQWMAAEQEAKRKTKSSSVAGSDNSPVVATSAGDVQESSVKAEYKEAVLNSMDVISIDLRNDDEPVGNKNNEESECAATSNDKSKINIINPEIQMKVNLALSEYRKVFQTCTPNFEEAIKIRKMIKLIHEYDPSSMMMEKQDLQIMDLFLANLEMRLGTNLNNLSAKFSGSQQCTVDLSGGEVFIKKGYQSLINSMVRKSNAFQFSTVVKEINYSNDAIQITAINTALSEDEPIHYNGHVAVCALPLGVLKESLNNPSGTNSPQFVPSLPDWKCKSIKNVGFGLLDKVILCFKERFWGANKNKIFAQLKSQSENRGDFVQFYAMSVSSAGTNIMGVGATGLQMQQDSSDGDSDTSSIDGNHQDDAGNNGNMNTNGSGNGKGNPGIIVGILCGQAAQNALDKQVSDEELGKRALDCLKSIFRKKKIAVPEPTSVHVCRWECDPFVRGSVSYLADGASIDDIINIGTPIPIVNNNQVTTTAATQEHSAPPASRTRRSFNSSTTNVNNSTNNSNSSSCNQVSASITSSSKEVSGLNTGSASNLNSIANIASLPHLFFTGEHTHHHGPGSIQAAMLSGLRVATEICMNYFPQLPNIVSRLPNNLQFRK